MPALCSAQLLYFFLYGWSATGKHTEKRTTKPIFLRGGFCHRQSRPFKELWETRRVVQMQQNTAIGFTSNVSFVCSNLALILPGLELEYAQQYAYFLSWKTYALTAY